MHYLSVPWNMSLKFYSWNVIRSRKEEPINVQFFRLLSALIKVHPISCAIFVSTFSVITPLYFLFQTLYTLNKNSPSKWNFWTFEWLGKNSQNCSCHIWNHTSHFFFKICITFQSDKRSFFCTYMAETLHDFYKSNPWKCTI